MENALKPIVIYGGTFDPIHLGHLHLIEAIWERISPEKIFLVPSNQSPIRPRNVASSSDRLLMAKMALSTLNRNIAVEVDDCEISRGGNSYTIDTLRRFRERFGAKKPICILMGADAFNDFTRWFQWEEILKLAHLLVVNRPTKIKHVHPEEWENLLRENVTRDLDGIYSKPSGYIFFVDFEPLSISATEIRNLLEEQRMNPENALKYLPENVWYYIYQNNLYKK